MDEPVVAVSNKVHLEFRFLIRRYFQIPDRFGLKDSSDQRWHNLFEHIRALNEEAPENVCYKFFLLSRHGQGYRKSFSLIEFC